MLNRLFQWLFDAGRPKENTQKTVSPESKTISQETQALMTQIDSKRLDVLERSVLTLALSVQRLIEEEKKTQEYLIHVATLHEELLNQLDTGNIAMVRVKQDTSNVDDDLDAMLRDEPEIVKTKKDMN